MTTDRNEALSGGVVSFLFTDVQGSTKLWEQHPDQMRSALEAHDAILRSSITAANGKVFSTAGDAFAAAFGDPEEAIHAAIRAQQELASFDWPADAQVKVRMGVHTGQAQRRGDDFFGPTLNRAARLMSAAHGGQTVVSSATQQLAPEVPLLDMGEHRLKDLSRSERVWQLLVEGLAADFPPLRTLNAVPTNLPVELASFVGRQLEITTLMGELESHRLVTVTGVGGVGKTRLSLQVAADASHHYPQGLWFVELAPVRIAEAVEYRFLETLGLEAEPGRRPVDTVARFIGDGSVLLVIDNCEHVVGPTSDTLKQLLKNCPNIKVLASSRRALGIGGEQVRAIHPLGTSGLHSAATQLFMDRALAAGADPTMIQRIDVIAEICRRLDGVPLALELAAARTRSMTPEDLAARLGERLRLLKGARSGSNERHQTLQSTIDWSFQLLDAQQQLLFSRLAVFTGTFALRAAEQICSDDELDEFDIVDLVDDLVQNSLLVADTTGSSTRYRMLESIRDFALSQARDQIATLRDRHVAYHVDWVAGISSALKTESEAVALEELELGWSDLRSAAAHAIGDLSRLAALIAPLVYDGMFRSRLEVAAWAAAGLGVAGSEESPQTRALLLGAAAALSGLGGQGALAVQFATELTELCESTGTPMPLELAGATVGGAVMTGNVALAARLQALADEASTLTSDPWEVAMTCVFRAVTCTYTGQPAAAAEASAAAGRHLPRNLAPSFRALQGWMAAVNGGEPSEQVVLQMEQVVAQATLVKSSFLQAVFNQVLSSERAKLNNLDEAMEQAADSLAAMRRDENFGLATAAVRRAAVLLMRVEEWHVASELLSWVDKGDSIPPPADLRAELDQLLPQLALSAPGARSGATLSTDAAIELTISTLQATLTRRSAQADGQAPAI